MAKRLCLMSCREGKAGNVDIAQLPYLAVLVAGKGGRSCVTGLTVGKYFKGSAERFVYSVMSTLLLI